MSTFFERVGTSLAPKRPDYGPATTSGMPDIPAHLYGTALKYAASNGAYWGSPGTADHLEPGFYTIKHCHQRGPVLTKITAVTDDLLRLPDPVCDMLLAEFVTFWESVPKIIARGFLAKRGLLLWGPPGSGKTSALNLMAAHMIKELRGIVVMAGEPHLTVAGLQLIRSIEAERPIILIYEDFDSLVERYGEAGFLAMLDGEAQIGGVVNVATTNYPERLDKRFVDRPGRFDRITECPMPSTDARRAYLKAKAPEVDDLRRERWVIATDGLSLGHLRELIVAHIGLGEDEKAVLGRLTEMHEVAPQSRQMARVGFS